MRDTKKAPLLAATALLIFFVLPPTTSFGTQQIEKSARSVTAQEKEVLARLNRSVKDYLKQRSQVAEKLPKLSKDSTPEQIQAYQKALIDGLRAVRTNARPGDIFDAATANYIRRILRTEVKGKERQEVRETVLEADTKGVPLKVNHPYPETKELVEVPATLLLKLPELPKEVKYRFVGRHLLLVDTDSGLIVDYMLNALP